MKLKPRDISLVLVGLKSISTNESYTQEQQRIAKELEDKIGANFSKGCTLSRVQSMSDFDAKPQQGND